MGDCPLDCLPLPLADTAYCFFSRNSQPGLLEACRPCRETPYWTCRPCRDALLDSTGVKPPMRAFPADQLARSSRVVERSPGSFLKNGVGALPDVRNNRR
jgi:hypothetical protein